VHGMLLGTPRQCCRWPTKGRADSHMGVWSRMQHGHTCYAAGQPQVNLNTAFEHLPCMPLVRTLSDGPILWRLQAIAVQLYARMNGFPDQNNQATSRATLPRDCASNCCRWRLACVCRSSLPTFRPGWTACQACPCHSWCGVLQSRCCAPAS
jgi:hypothetical protein